MITKGGVTSMALYPYILKLAELPVRCWFHQPIYALHLQEHVCSAADPVADVALDDEEWADVLSRADAEHDEAYYEFNALVPKLSDAVLPYGRCLFHGLAFLWHGKAYLFSAPSGTGKTTLYVLWKLLFGDEITIINGDKPMLWLREDGSLWVCPTPWTGKESNGSMEQAPLGGIVVLQQSEADHCRRAEKAEAVALLYHQFLYSSSSEALIEQVCQMETAILRTAPVWIYACTGSPASAQLLHDTILHDEGIIYEA